MNSRRPRFFALRLTNLDGLYDGGCLAAFRSLNRQELAGLGVASDLKRVGHSEVTSFPGQAHATAGSAWAPLHWLTGFASYGLIGAALLHAALLRHAERRLRAGTGSSGQIPSPARPKGQALGMPLLRLESLTLRFVAAGFVMLSLTLVLGAAFAPWRWDHKTVFSVLSWAVFAVLLTGRARFGWRGQQAIRWLVAGSTLLLLAYVGSRFVLEIILHRPVVA